MLKKPRLIKLLSDLIRIDSQNPPGDESRIAVFLRDYFDKLGLRAKICVFKKQRANIIVALGGKAGHRLLITPHLDTVPAGNSWRFNPLRPKIKNGRIYGLGATDCKGNLACALEAIRSLLEEKVRLNYRLIFAATADEESGSSLGLVPLLKRGILRPDSAVVLDSNEFEIVVTQKGLLHLKVVLEGRRAHGAYPWRGVNAIGLASSIINELKAYHGPYRRNKYLRPPTVNVGTIRGGDKVNIVADWCEFELDFRFLPGMSAQAVLRDLKGIIRKYCKRFRIEVNDIQQPYSIDEDSPLVGQLKRAMRKFKINPKLKGSEGATVITFFQEKKIPAVATGFGSCGCAHIADEYATIDNLHKGALVLEDFLKNYNLNS
jgi:succinyl-diaminopimelate desuccinylase